MGQVNSYWREFVSREASEFGTRVARTVGSLRDRFAGQDDDEPDADTTREATTQ
jgi:hypothetical protein